jgi:pimeloyl-ACP methyl ester carboxylesterase
MPFATIDPTLEMYYQETDFADPWRPHETVILHHGNMKNHRLWYAWVPVIAREFCVITLDARGFGQSTVPEAPYPWSLSNFAKDTVGLMDQLGVSSAHVIGESIGGSIALQLAYEYPERLKTVTACASPYRLDGTQATADSIENIGLAAWVQGSMGNRLEPGASDPEHARWYAEQMAQTDTRVAVDLFRRLDGMNLTSILPKMSVPALIIGGDVRDGHLERVQGMHVLMPGSQVALIRGGSGFVQHSAPQSCVEAWLQFVHERSSAPV